MEDKSFNYSPEFKASVIKDFIKGNKTLEEIYSQYNIPSEVFREWQYELLNEIDGNFIKEEKEDLCRKQILLKEIEIEKLINQKELLKQFISELKFSRNLDQAYSYVLKKLADIFNADRTLFIEMQTTNGEKPYTKYEYLRNKDLPSFIGINYPKATTEDFYEMYNNPENLNILVVNDSEEHHKNDPEAQEFLRKNNIKSMLITLLVRYTKGVQVLGSLVICSSTKCNWSDEEKDLLKSISDSIVEVIWEIARLIEIDEIRNTFILTLAHDFQVPLIGERKVLEYVISKSPDEPLGKLKDFIEETIKSNRNLSVMVDKLLNIYSYETGKREFHFTWVNIAEYSKNILKKLESYAASKDVNIKTDVQENLPDVMADKTEISKVLNCIIVNALDHTRRGTQVTVSYKLEKDMVKVGISDMGEGIPADVRDRIFSRYPMVQAIQRKIGAGLGLYLSKLIIEAHKGKIWFDTEVGKGTTFYFTLPIAKPEISS